MISAIAVARRQRWPLACAPARLLGLQQQLAWVSQTPNGFAALGIQADLVQALSSRQSITAPSPIQAAAIPPILQGKSVALQSYTGSGKTLAYLLPVLTSAMARASDPGNRAGRGALQALVIAPSTDLALQVERVVKELLPEGSGGRQGAAHVVGGTALQRQVKRLRAAKPLLVVGTPGRLLEMADAGHLALGRVPVVVLEEADQMLRMPMRADADRLSSLVGRLLPLGAQRQAILVSASLAPALLPKFEKWCASPLYVSAAPPQAPGSGIEAAAAAAAEAAAAVEPSASSRGETTAADAQALRSAASSAPSSHAAPTPDALPAAAAPAAAPVVMLPPNIRHFHILSQSSDLQAKVKVVRQCMHALGMQRALIFLNSRDQSQRAMLAATKLQAAVYHGGMAAQSRRAALEAFRSGAVRALVVSDAAARGLDVPDCDAVFHLELAATPEQYAHRAGRAGRMGMYGVSISVVDSEAGERALQRLGRQLGAQVQGATVSGDNFVPMGASPPVAPPGAATAAAATAEAQVGRDEAAGSGRVAGTMEGNASVGSSGKPGITHGDAGAADYGFASQQHMLDALFGPLSSEALHRQQQEAADEQRAGAAAAASADNAGAATAAGTMQRSVPGAASWNDEEEERYQAASGSASHEAASVAATSVPAEGERRGRRRLKLKAAEPDVASRMSAPFVAEVAASRGSGAVAGWPEQPRRAAAAELSPADATARRTEQQRQAAAQPASFYQSERPPLGGTTWQYDGGRRSSVAAEVDGSAEEVFYSSERRSSRQDAHPGASGGGSFSGGSARRRTGSEKGASAMDRVLRYQDYLDRRAGMGPSEEGVPGDEEDGVSVEPGLPRQGAARARAEQQQQQLLSKAERKAQRRQAKLARLSAKMSDQGFVMVDDFRSP